MKRERASLLQSLASLKADQGKSGRDLQSDDIRRLRKEMELKKDKVNELRQVADPHQIFHLRHCTPWHEPAELKLDIFAYDSRHSEGCKPNQAGLLGKFRWIGWERKSMHCLGQQASQLDG